MESNGDIRNKRKNSPIITKDRPAKLLKAEPLPLEEDDDMEPTNGLPYMVESDEEEARLMPLVAAAADTAEWQATIEKVVRNVVSIHFCQTCSFDTDAAISSEATGFVVDAVKGYILTNRHVVSYGTQFQKYTVLC